MTGHNWIGILQPSDASKPAQPGGCVQCHPGLGARPNPIDRLSQADWDNIDCLICHAPAYKRTVVKDGERLRIGPADGVDVLAAARSVGKPSTEMCLRCHLSAGGGPNHKHGVAPTSPEADVHLAKGVGCVDCHPAVDHRFAGGADLKVRDAPDATVSCARCHQKAHQGELAAVLAKHSARLACQTCHIPAIARDPKFPTMVRRDWTRPVLNETTGLYGPTNQMTSNVTPVYRWWNGRMRVPPEPVGSIGDPAAKIFPWKRVAYTVIADARSSRPIFIKAGVYAVKGDAVAAAKKGAEDAKQDFSGAIQGQEEVNLYSLNHQVAPRGQTLACATCHRSDGILDFKALGYSAERVKALSEARSSQR